MNNEDTSLNTSKSLSVMLWSPRDSSKFMSALLLITHECFNQKFFFCCFCIVSGIFICLAK